MNKLLSTLVDDAEKIASAELPALSDIPSLFHALLNRAEAALPQLLAAEVSALVHPGTVPSNSAGVGQAAGALSEQKVGMVPVEVTPTVEPSSVVDAAQAAYASSGGIAAAPGASTIQTEPAAELATHVEVPATVQAPIAAEPSAAENASLIAEQGALIGSLQAQIRSLGGTPVENPQ